MTTTKIIILAIIFGLSILFFWLAFHKKKPKKPIQDMPIYPHTPSRPKPQPTTTTTTTTEWRETEQRRKAASEAATKMCEHRMNNRGSEAVQIRQVINQHRINVNISALNTAQDKIMRICAHAEKIRDNISRYRNNPNYLKQLYREGVGASDEAHKLRLEIKALRDMLYRMGATNHSIRALHKQVNAFYQSVYEDEIELNNRNRILRTYIGRNFGSAERRWNDDIERRAMVKRAS